MTDNMVIYCNKEIFSPYYKCNIHFPTIELSWFNCTSVVQCFEIAKLMFFHNYDRLFYASSIVTPLDYVRVGHEIKNFDKQIWSDVKYDIMYQIELQKYLQNDTLRAELISSKYNDAEFVYANALDTFWGIGIGENSLLTKNKVKWKGKNIHGQIIYKVRKDIIEKYK